MPPVVSVDLPRPFLFKRLSDDKQFPSLGSVCPGFELQKWRVDRLAAHLIDWLPDFAIRHDDLPDAIGNITDYRLLLERAARRVYDTEKTAKRGEIGELLLHAICRQFSGTFPTVSKVYYKTASNDVVKGFDLVHTRFDAAKDVLELWLGEAKFYQAGDDAVADAISSVTAHLKAGFLTAEKTLLGGKISSDTPGYEKLEWLFERDTPLDEIFERLVVPILIAYDSTLTANYDSDGKYNPSLLMELNALHKAFTSKLPRNMTISCFYFPMDSKRALIDQFDARLRGLL